MDNQNMTVVENAIVMKLDRKYVGSTNSKDWILVENLPSNHESTFSGNYAISNIPLGISYVANNIPDLASGVLADCKFKIESDKVISLELAVIGINSTANPVTQQTIDLFLNYLKN